MNYLDTNTATSELRVSMTDGKEETCAALSEILRTGVDVHRCAAAQALGVLNVQGAVAPLSEALRDEDEDVRTDAATALAHYPGEQAASELLKNLIGDPNMDVKAAAIEGLAAMGDTNVIPWLHRMVEGRDEEIVWDEEQYYQDGWDSWVDIQMKAIVGLAALHDEKAVPIIRAAIDDEMGQDLSEAGFKALAALGQPGVAALADYLQTGGERLRRRAAVSLGLADAKLAAPVLRSGLTDGAVDVRLSALRVLASFDPTDPALSPMFEDSSAQVRAQMARLAGMRDTEALQRLFNDPKLRVRVAVMEALEENPALVPEKTTLAWVRTELTSGRAKLAAQAAQLLGALHPAGAFEDLAALLTDTTRPESVRLAAIKALAKFPDDRAVEVLSGYVGDPSRQVRMDVLVALARLAQAEPSAIDATEILLAALRGELIAAPEPDENQADAELLPATSDDGEEQPEPVAESTEAPTSTLQSILGVNSPELKVLKREGDNVELSHRDMEFLGLAQNKLRKRRVAVTSEIAPHQDVRRFAARVMGNLPTPEIVIDLTAALTDEDKEVSLNAADSLVRLAENGATMPEETRTALAVLTEQSDRALRLSGIRALGIARVSEHLPLLDKLLADPDSYVRTDALRSCALLGEFGDRATALLGDVDPSVRLAAAQALALVKRQESIPELVSFAFTAEGYHRKETAQLLRNLDLRAATDGFLAVLNDPDRRREWQVSIESLAILHDVGQGQVT